MCHFRRLCHFRQDQKRHKDSDYLLWVIYIVIVNNATIFYDRFKKEKAVPRSVARDMIFSKGEKSES